MKRLFSLVALLASLGPLTGQDKKEAPASVEQELFKLTNQERAKAKKAALKHNDVLTTAAKQHAEELAKKNSVSEAIDGKATLERLKRLGGRFAAASENVAFGNQTPEEVVALWMGSELHRNNMLLGQYTQIGIGQAKSIEGTTFFVVIFASLRR